ncbi:uncharacterized protein LOC115970365 [Quercus lobata]|uniref:uncharacterized protein LOC115970365 n=1 Tax=Quercus lobata TaxID=97700 RepID=UPI001245EC85|nr:uncharacterized protein LOC115970365 [Quercus lobata]
MAGNPLRQNQNLYCQYHQDQGHTTEDCRNLWDHLDQLVREGKLKHLLHHSNSRGGQTNSEPRRDDSSRLPLGRINAIFTAPGRTGSYLSRVMSVARLSTKSNNLKPKKARVEIRPVLGFSDEDKIRTIQPHDDALVVTLKIGGYDVKSVSGPSFEGKTVIRKGQIRLPIQTGLKVVEVNFIVMDAYSPYTAIVARPWLHALEAVSSTLHQKVKYPSGGRVEEIVGNQPVARQCLVAAIS